MPSLAADAVPTWVALAAAAACLLAAALAVPTAPPPDAARLARTVDTVAASDHPASRTVPLRADAVHVTPHAVSLRNDAGTATARFRDGRVVPVSRGPLVAVLAGRSASTIFDSPAAFRRVIRHALDRERGWRRARRIRVRRVSWRGVDVTLVG